MTNTRNLSQLIWSDSDLLDFIKPELKFANDLMKEMKKTWNLSSVIKERSGSHKRTFSNISNLKDKTRPNSKTKQFITKMLKGTKPAKGSKLKASKENTNFHKYLTPSVQPMLPPKLPHAHKYTLVLDMDETLIHYVNSLDESKFSVKEDEDLCFYSRPGVF